MSIPRTSAVPRDGDGVPLTNHFSEVGTKVFADVDTTTGVDIEFTTDIRGLTIIPSAAATFAGTVTDYDDAMPFSSALPLDVKAPANTKIGTVKAASGTISVYCIFGRK